MKRTSKKSANTCKNLSVKMKYWREAATLILAVKNCSNVLNSPMTYAAPPDESIHITKHPNDRTAADYKILMLKRSKSISFLPSQMVFPGGILSDVDHSRKWFDLFCQYTGQPPENLTRYFQVSGPRPPMVSEKRPLWGGITADVAFRLCAIRETFEESGLLLVLPREELSKFPDIKSRNLSTLKRWNELEKLALERWRKLMITNASAFFEMCAELQVFPNIWAMYEWSNWLTPVLQKVEKPIKKPMRFDTMFYICCLECDGLPSISVDHTETVLFQWKPPLEYLVSGSGKTSIVPQVYELKRLLNFQSLAELDQFCVDRATKGLECYMSVIQLCNDGFVQYLPGDWSYPENPDYEGTTDGLTPLPLKVSELQDESKAMHRLVFQQSSATLTLVCNRPLSCGHVSPLEFLPDIVNTADVLSSKM